MPIKGEPRDTATNILINIEIKNKSIKTYVLDDNTFCTWSKSDSIS